MTALDRLLEALRGGGFTPQRSGRGWRARCPAHEDRKPSLSITPAADRVLLHCHAGCSPEAIVRAVGLTLADLFERQEKIVDPGSLQELGDRLRALDEAAAMGPEPSGPQREIEAIYPYVDEGGNLLYEVVRFRPKDFRQRRPDSKGGWIWNLDGTRRVLYRLPQVLAAIREGKLIYVVEGEKDVHAVEEAGGVATTCPGGAGKWRPEFSETLRGADVVVVADRDEPGRRHAQQVVQRLAGVAKSIRLAEPVEGKDISDHLAAGRGLDELDFSVGPYISPNRSEALPVRTLEDLIQDPALAGDVEWVAAGLIPRAGTTLLYGMGKAGKSTLAIHLAVCVARGEPFLDRPVTSGPVLYIDVENSPRLLRRKFLEAGAVGLRHPIYIYCGPAPALDAVRASIKELNPVLLVIDSLPRVLQLHDENDAAEVNRKLPAWLELANEGDLALFGLYHDRKSEGEFGRAIRGSSAILAAVDVAIHFRREGDGTDGRRRLDVVSRFDEGNNLRLIIRRDPEGTYSVEGTPAEARHKQLLAVLAQATEPITIAEWATRAGFDRATIYPDVQALHGAGRVQRFGTGRRGDPYRYSVVFVEATPANTNDGKGGFCVGPYMGANTKHKPLEPVAGTGPNHGIVQQTPSGLDYEAIEREAVRNELPALRPVRQWESGPELLDGDAPLPDQEGEL